MWDHDTQTREQAKRSAHRLTTKITRLLQVLPDDTQQP